VPAAERGALGALRHDAKRRLDDVMRRVPLVVRAQQDQAIDGRGERARLAGQLSVGLALEEFGEGLGHD
jgi:hypothetical protein